MEPGRGKKRLHNVTAIYLFDDFVVSELLHCLQACYGFDPRRSPQTHRGATPHYCATEKYAVFTMGSHDLRSGTECLCCFSTSRHGIRIAVECGDIILTYSSQRKTLISGTSIQHAIVGHLFPKAQPLIR